VERLFDVETAAEKLGGISAWTLRGWLSQGKIKKTKVGRRTMIAESELDRFVRESQRQDSRRQDR
jgi:excisionase family DNA binding protein